jgi:effector-associated domain 2 (EAD2)-containing protein
VADARVVLVGIDEYEAGPGWTLQGPVDDAIRFAEFFVGQGVSPAQITVLATPIPAPSALPTGVVGRAADRATVRDVLIRELSKAQESTLYVLWGGHGYIDLDHHRRLLYPDAVSDDLVDLDLDSLLTRFRSDHVGALGRQVWVVDACQVHGPRVSGHETFPSGEAVEGRAQDVYVAAGYGQAAVNLNRQRTGLFSREVLKLIEDGGLPLLTDPRRLTDALEARFTALRAGGGLDQTPTYLWYRHGIGNEGQILRRATGSAARQPALTPPTPAQLAPVVNALLEIDEFRNPHDREAILSLIRSAVYASMDRSRKSRPDAVGVVRGSLKHRGGLRELVEAVRFYSDETSAVERFTAAAERLIS